MRSGRTRQARAAAVKISQNRGSPGSSRAGTEISASPVWRLRQNASQNRKGGPPSGATVQSGFWSRPTCQTSPGFVRYLRKIVSMMANARWRLGAGSYAKTGGGLKGVEIDHPGAGIVPFADER